MLSLIRQAVLRDRYNSNTRHNLSPTLLPFIKVLRKSKLSKPPPADVRFYNNTFTATKTKSYFIKLVNKTIKEALLYNFKYIAA